MKNKSCAVIAMFAALVVLAGCTSPQESHRTVQTQKVATYRTDYSGPKAKLAIGAFQNRSPYMNGIFSDGKDRLGIQAKQILMTHLSNTNRFVMLDRENMKQLASESEMAGTAQQLTGASVIITGAVTEFGRRETGGTALGGILGRSRTQTAYAKVSISIVDVSTSRVRFSTQGAGEFDLTNEHVLGFGSEAGYDATLTDKVLNLAMIDAVNHLVSALERGEWSPEGSS